MAKETPASDPGASLAPVRLAHFLTGEVLEQDSIGTWYRAEQDDPPRTVALRVVNPETISKDHDLRYFRWVADGVGRLRHPSIAGLHAVGHDADGRLFYAVDLASGEPLDRFVDRNPVTRRSGVRDIRALLRMFRRVCDVVAYAHEHGLIHGRLDPSAIRVESSKQDGLEAAARTASIKVVDFGLGRALVNPILREKRSDTALDSLAYLAPEQLAGQPPDMRGDVYSLGLLLYRILTGVHPCLGRDFSVVVLARGLRDKPETPSAAWRALGRRRMSDELETIILKAMAKDPRHRYPNVWALGEDLRRYLDREPILARRPTIRYRLRKAIDRHKATAAAAAWALLVIIEALLG